MSRNLILISVHHLNDFERLKYYPAFFQGQDYIFLNLSSSEINFEGYRNFDLSNKNGLLFKIKFNIFLIALSLIGKFRKLVFITPYKMEPQSNSVFGKLVNVLRKSNATIWLVPHGITSYRQDKLSKGMMDANLIFYNSDFELSNSDLLKAKAEGKELYRIGDLKLFNIFETHSSKLLRSEKYKVAILASNLNQFDLEDEKKLEAIIDGISLAKKSFPENEIIFRPHPRYPKFSEDVKKLFPDVVIDLDKSNLPVILNSKYVIAITSTAIYETLLLNDNLIVIEPKEFRGKESIFKNSPLITFYSDELSDLKIPEITFEGKESIDWVKTNLLTERSELESLIKKLLN